MKNEYLGGAFVFDYKEEKQGKSTLTINFNDELKWIFATQNIKDYGDFRDFMAFKGDYAFDIDDLGELKDKDLFNDKYFKYYGLNVKEFEELAQRLHAKYGSHRLLYIYEKFEHISSNSGEYFGVGDKGFFIDARRGNSLDLIETESLDDRLESIFNEAMRRQGLDTSKTNLPIKLSSGDFIAISAHLPTIFEEEIYDWTKTLIKHGYVELEGYNEYRSEYAKLLIFDYAKRRRIKFELDLEEFCIHKDAEAFYRIDDFFEKQILEFYSKNDELKRRIYTSTLEIDTANSIALDIMKTNKDIDYCLIKLKGAEEIKIATNKEKHDFLNDALQKNNNNENNTRRNR